MKKILSLIIVTVTVLTLCSCSDNKLPDEWVVLSYEEAESLYHNVDFTMENINDYLEIGNETEEYYNEWDELTSKNFINGIRIPAKNFIQFDTPDDEFLMDISYTVQERYVQLDPKTLEEIGEDENKHSISEKTHTISHLRINNFLASNSYSISYNPDGTVKTDENNELWVYKYEFIDMKVDRIRGHAEWIADIPDKYFLTYEDSSRKDVIIEGKEYYYEYNNLADHDHYQTNGRDKKGNSVFGMGNCISFIRGRE